MNPVPLHMGDWILYRDTGSLFHKKCKRFHNTPSRTHICRLYDNRICISGIMVTTVNVCREVLRNDLNANCTLPFLSMEIW